MTKQSVHYLLVPDSSSSRCLRRRLAESKARLGVIVGTWQELLELACNAYFVPTLDDEWDDIFDQALTELSDVFWQDSLEIAKEETSTVIEQALLDLIGASKPAWPIEIATTKHLQAHPRKYLNDLKRLLECLGNRLPPTYKSMHALLSSSQTDAMRNIHVYQIDDYPTLNRWQAAVIEKLNADANTLPDNDLQAHLCAVAQPKLLAAEETSLYQLQHNLFTTPEHKNQLDDSLQWVGVRDFLSEAETAATMAQTLLRTHTDLHPSDIGLLVPHDYEYALAVEETFALAGLPVSGLTIETWQRDLGRELIFHFLYCRQSPAPAMALAVCLSSYLMPWSREQGAQLAQELMDGDYRLDARSMVTPNERDMLALLRGADEDPESLKNGLQQFVSLLSNEVGVAQHVQNAIYAADVLYDMLDETDEIDWITLRRAVTPKYIRQDPSADFNQEGITVWREGHEAWRHVRHLIVMGFSEKHYPLTRPPSSVFEEQSLDVMADALGIAFTTPSQHLQIARDRFKRQLSVVKDSVTFLVPRRNTPGATQVPSDSIIFMHDLFEGEKNRILEMDSTTDRSLIAHYPCKGPMTVQCPREMIAHDIEFNRNLLELLADEAGNVKPESPSSLETLLVSPLAWLLRRLDAEPQGWAPERSNVLLLGNIAHDVFEYLFQQGLDGLDLSILPIEVEQHLDKAIDRNGPFLHATQWQVEKTHLGAELLKSVQYWIDVLQHLNADILACEAWLHGSFHGIPIHGKADLLLGLPNDRVLIIDYKRSSANSRRPRLEKGYDSQASLYRTMITSGGLKDRSDQALVNQLSQARHLGIVYFTLNDLALLADCQILESGSIPGWVPFTNDISDKAIQRIKQRIDEISEGLIILNREGDEKFWDKEAGVKPYALDNSPLISLFTLKDDARGLA